MNLQEKCERADLGSISLRIMEFVWGNTIYLLDQSLVISTKGGKSWISWPPKCFLSVHSSWDFSGLIFPCMAGHKGDLVSDSGQLCLAHNRHPVKTHWMEFVAPIDIKPKGLFYWYFLDLWYFPYISGLFQFLIFPSWIPKCSAVEFILWLVPHRDREATI